MVPCYFDVQIREKPLGLIFDIHQELVNHYNKIVEEVILNKGLEEFIARFSQFRYFKKIQTYRQLIEGNGAEEPKVIIEKRESLHAGLYDEYLARNLFGEYFALNKAIVKTQATKNFIRYEAPIPAAFFYGQSKCPRCRGTKIDPDYEELELKCQYCQGSSRQTINNKLTIKILADNLALLSRMVEALAYQVDKKQTSLATSKPLTIYVGLHNDGYHGQDIFGAYTKELADFILFLVNNQQVKQLIQQINERMLEAFCLLINGQTSCSLYNLFHFKTKLEKAEHKDLGINFLLEVPGENSCSVYTYDSLSAILPLCQDLKQTDSFNCHNVDSPAQQISLLVGLATLNTAARQWLGNNKD